MSKNKDVIRAIMLAAEEALTPKQRAKVEACEKELRTIVKNYGDTGFLALNFIFYEYMEKVN